MAFTLQAVVALDGSKFTGGMTGMLASVQRFAGMSMTMFGGVAGQVASMWAAFGPMGGVMAGMQSVIKVGASFEQSMANVKSVTGLMGDEFVRVSNATRAAAAQTAFTTAQAADAMYALGASGMSSADMLEASLLPALKLAGATQSDTKLATEAMTAAMAVWQLGAQDATGVADLFAGAIASSPANMHRLSDAMKYAGPVGAAFGMEMKNVVDEVAAFHVVGLRGQQAGTSFRMALIELSRAAQTGSGQVGAALKGWSAETEGLTGAVDRLNAAGVDGASVIQEMGAKAGPGMAALLKVGGDAMRDLSDKVTQNSDVAKMYETQMGTLSGQFTLLKASIEELAVKLFSKLLPAFMKIIDGAKNFVSSIERIAESFGFVGTAIERLLPLLIGGGGLLLAFGKISAFIPGLAGGLTGLFKGAAMSMAPTAAAMTAIGTKTMPMLATASAALSKQMGVGANGFFQLTNNLHQSTHKMAVMSGGVTKMTTAQYSAITATYGFTGSLTILQAAILGVIAAIAGFYLGRFIRDIQAGEKSVGGWVDQFVAWAGGLGSIEDANQDVIYVVQKRAKAQKKAAEEAETTAKQEARWNEYLADSARAADRAYQEKIATWIASQKVSDNNAAKNRILADTELAVAVSILELSGMMVLSTETANQSAEAKRNLTSAGEAVSASITALTDAQIAEAAQQQAVNDLERAARDAKDAHSKAARDLAGSVGAGAEMGEAGALATQALTEAAAEAMSAENALKAAQDALTNSQMTAKEKADALALATANLADKQEAARRVVDRSITEYNTMEALVTGFNMTIEDSRQAFADFGAEAVTVASKAHQLKMPFSEIAENFKWIARNGDFAKDMIKKEFGGAIQDVQGIMERFGKHTLDIVRQMVKTGESAEEAATSLGILKTGMEDGGPAAEDAIKQMTKLGDEVLRFGKVLTKLDAGKLEAIYKAVKEFAGKMALLPKLNLGWMRDLAQLRLPPIGNADNWGRNFDKLIGVLQKAVGLTLALEWMKPLTEFRLPPIGNADNWGKNWKILMDAIDAAKKPDLSWVKDIVSLTSFDTDKLKMIADILNGIKSGSYNATVLIGWKDNSTLQSIDGNLKTLAGMKGVIWA